MSRKSLAPALLGALVLVGCGSPPSRTTGGVEVGGVGNEAERSTIEAPTAPSTPRVDAGRYAATVTTVAVGTVSDPVSVTGYRIGDRVDTTRSPSWINEDGQVNPDDLPEWMAVSDRGVIVGYQRRVEPPDSPADVDPSEHPELLIYDEQEVLIGEFRSGAPVIWSEVAEEQS